jgi:LysR family carnitine catabolism transcriptional activator
MPDLPVRRMMTLVSLAGTSSFRQTAQELKLSQPAVSAHIRDLEAYFGVPLVYRTTRRVSLTAEGMALAARARRAFEELEMASQDLRDLAAVHRGRVVLACIPPMMARIVPNAVQRLAVEYPAIAIEIRDVLSGQVEQLVERGDADIGIGPQPRSSELSFTRLLRDPFVAAVPADHALASRKAVDMDELLKHPLVMTTVAANARSIVDQTLQRSRRRIKPRFEVVHNFSVGGLVAVGLGVTILPRMAIPSLGAEGIKIVDIRSPRIFRDIGAITRPKYRPSPAVRALMTVLDRVITESRGQTRR